MDQFSSTICILLRSACIAKFRYPSVLIRTILVVLVHGQFCTRVNISTTCQFIIKHDVSLYIYSVCQKIPVYFEALYLLQFLEVKENKNMLTKHTYSTIALHKNKLNFSVYFYVWKMKNSLMHRRRLHRGNRELRPGTHARTAANVAFCPGTFHGYALIF